MTFPLLVAQETKDFMTAIPDVVLSIVALLGAAGFGAIIGWLVYYINRYRVAAVQFSDLTTLMGIIGGGAVLALFPARSALFGAYGIGLAIGFFSYFARLNTLVERSMGAAEGAFDWEWFLDGRRKNPKDGQGFGAGGEKQQTGMGAARPPGAPGAP